MLTIGSACSMLLAHLIFHPLRGTRTAVITRLVDLSRIQGDDDVAVVLPDVEIRFVLYFCFVGFHSDTSLWGGGGLPPPLISSH